jgi:pimeloyl-ACP methyl ester carboxylesterase
LVAVAQEVVLKHFPIIALAATAVSSPSAVEVEGHQVVGRAIAAINCDVDRILPDPSLRRFVVWKSPRDLRGPIATTLPSGAVVGELPPGDDDGEALPGLFSIGTNARVEPLRWNDDGEKLLVRVRDNGAVIVDLASKQLALAPALDPLWSHVRIEALSHGDLGFYRHPALIERLRSIFREGTPTRTVASLGRDTATFLVFRPGNDFRFTTYRKDRGEATNIRIAFASAPILPPESREPIFMGDQTGYADFLPYALPLVNRADATIAGRFGLERIEVRGAPPIDLAPRFNQLMAVQDASAQGETVIALVDLEREKRVIRVRGRRIDSWRLCEKSSLQLGTRTIPAENSLPAATPVRRTLIRFTPEGPASAPGPFALLYRPVHADGRLLVYFHGGPTATLAGPTVPNYVRDFAAEGVSVLAVEYSGMLGGGLRLSERLRKLGLKALRQDVDSVTRWVRHSGFERVYLLGDSFGGIPAAIAAVDHPDAYSHIFFRAPLLSLRPPQQSVRRGNFFGGEVASSSQLEFEEAVYGGARGRTRFGRDLRAYVGRLAPSSRMSFYFGSLDPVSAVSDLPPAFTGHASVMTGRAQHAFVAVMPEVWPDILAKMAPPGQGGR